MQVHPSAPTIAPWTVPGASTMRSPGPSLISWSGSVKVIDPDTQYSTFS